ncbi:uncharacterized protein LOC107621161 isoform X4 [Arachis ipaensis]|uniref:uncharacterized protein LOC107621161 isoform X4 n=1 Tax=Arachis ipaensis TaxID=130454 RepID=UPI000A2B28B5|nr:uncharacterized protein LOC107621161 isoform X4 [Arachis ipaensis]XP_025684081.1 uncharacterized protein LOC112784929 isoform X2 [Arachis hypogaea]
MTKKERRPAKLHIVITNDTSQNTPQDRPQEGTNVTPLQIDPLEKAKKNKKKQPKTIGRSNPSLTQDHVDEIPLSQTTPQADEPASETINLNQRPPQQPIDAPLFCGSKG